MRVSVVKKIYLWNEGMSDSNSNSKRFELTSPLHLDLFPLEYRELKESLHSWYVSRSNRAYLATLYNAMATEGKFTFILSYQGVLSLLLNDVNFQGSPRISREFYQHFLSTLEKSGFFKKLKVLGEESVLTLTHPKMLAYFHRILGADHLASQKWSVLQWIKARDEFDTTEGGKGELLVGELDPRIVAKEKARSFGLITGGGTTTKQRLSRENSREKLKSEVEQLERLLATTHARYRSLLGEARSEDELRLQTEESGQSDPEVTHRAVIAGIKAGQQKRKLEEIEHQYLSTKERYERSVGAVLGANKSDATIERPRREAIIPKESRL
ncbi:MAG: hypothetical protein HQK52_20435 [Oligoflexia bacterium]|nr:hypothetical protein [Oligoflexia bacterium]